MDEPIFFATPEKWRSWLARNHAKESELLVGFWKVGSGRPSMTWAESVDEALCYGWIDGVRKGRDAESYTIRFTPRKPGSIWSATNVKHVERLEKEGRMTDAGRAAFARRKAHKTGVYSFENREQAKLAAEDEKRFRANRTAWANFQKTPPSYQTPALWWVVSAKKPETRERRLAQLIADSEAGLRVKHLRRR